MQRILASANMHAATAAAMSGSPSDIIAGVAGGNGTADTGAPTSAAGATEPTAASEENKSTPPEEEIDPTLAMVSFTLRFCSPRCFDVPDSTGFLLVVLRVCLSQ